MSDFFDKTVYEHLRKFRKDTDLNEQIEYFSLEETFHISVLKCKTKMVLPKRSGINDW